MGDPYEVMGMTSSSPVLCTGFGDAVVTHNGDSDRSDAAADATAKSDNDEEKWSNTNKYIEVENSL